MSSKRPDPAKSPKRWSITGRLAFLYTLSALVTLGVVAIFFIWAMRDSMYREESDFLNDRLRVYGSIIESQPNHLQIIRRDIDWEGAYVAFPEYYTRIVAGSTTILETPGMARLIPPALFSTPPTRRSYQGRERSVRHVVNGRVFLLSARTVDGFGTEGARTIQLAVDVSNGEAVIAEKVQSSIILFFVGIILATGVGVVVARQALSPVREITRVAEQITITRIDTRTDPERWPSELRSLAIAFNGMLDRLEESFARLSQVSSNLAHELRTPITILLGEAEVVLAKERTPDEYRRTIESAVDECLRLSRLIDRMLFLARAENPATRIARSRFDVMEELDKVVSYFEALAEERRADIIVSGNGFLSGDRLMFNRALSNLLANALYYSSPGVRIEVAVSQDEDGSLAVTVRDTGFGIAAEDLARIFDRFYRGEKTRASHPGGTGLGMAIVKSIMDLHGGTIDIISTPGTGTEVTLRFPAHDDTSLPPSGV